MKKQDKVNTQMSVITETGEVIENVNNKTWSPTRKKAVVGAAAILGACTLLFGGATQMALAAETSKTEKVPTTYPPVSSQQGAAAAQGYVKGNYQVVKNPNIPATPTANDITMEQAADIGAQNIWKLFGTNLDGKTMEMTYNKAVAPNGRASWSGWIANSSKKSSNSIEKYYSFEVDSLTGAINSVQLSRVLPGGTNGELSPSQGFDSNLEKNCQVYQDLARTITEQHHLLGGKIKSVEYYGQGATNNDPTITMAVKSEQGEEIRLEFSRHDKAFLGYCSDSWVQAANLLEQENVSKADASDTVVYEIYEDESGNVTPKMVSNSRGVKEEVFVSYTTTK